MQVTAPSLRRTLIASALVVVVAATAATLVALYVMMSMRDAIDRDSNSLLEEQRIADRIVTLAHQQQLDAFQYLQAPDDAHRRAFDVRGDSAHAQMQTYLFRDMSSAARLKVQRMKEAHESFEVTAHRSMDLAQRGDAAAAAGRVALLGSGALAFDSTVKDFLGTRIAQRVEPPIPVVLRSLAVGYSRLNPEQRLSRISKRLRCPFEVVESDTYIRLPLLCGVCGGTEVR